MEPRSTTISAPVGQDGADLIRQQGGAARSHESIDVRMAAPLLVAVSW